MDRPDLEATRRPLASVRARLLGVLLLDDYALRPETGYQWNEKAFFSVVKPASRGPGITIAT